MQDFDFSPIRKAVHCIVKLSRTDMQKRLADARIDITPLQCSVLRMVKCRPVTINDMARHFGFRSPSLVPVVDALEAQSLIERKPDAEDRRKTMLVIRQKGADLLKQIPPSDKKDALDTAFEKLSRQKQKELLELLEELLNNFPKQ